MRAPSPLERELQQRRPFASPSQEGVVSLMRTADVVRWRLGAVVEGHGITLQQYNVLRILRGAGVDGLPTLAIAERMVERAPGITRLLDRLEAKHLVRRRRCPDDRRQVLCFIEPGGLAVLEKLDRPLQAADRECLGRLNDTQAKTLIRLLDAVRAGAGRSPKPPSSGRVLPGSPKKETT